MTRNGRDCTWQLFSFPVWSLLKPPDSPGNKKTPNKKAGSSARHVVYLFLSRKFVCNSLKTPKKAEQFSTKKTLNPYPPVIKHTFKKSSSTSPNAEQQLHLEFQPYLIKPPTEN